MKNQLTQPNVLLPTKVDVNAEMNPTVSPLTLSGNWMFKDALRFTNPWTEQEKSFQLSLLPTAMLLTSCLVSKESVPFPVATRQLPGMVLPGLVFPLPTITGNLAMTMSSMMRNLCLALMKTVRILPMSGKSLNFWRPIQINLMLPECGLKDFLKTPCSLPTLVSVSLTKSWECTKEVQVWL